MFHIKNKVLNMLKVSTALHNNIILIEMADSKRIKKIVNLAVVWAATTSSVPKCHHDTTV